jgi:hypothetical protein
MILANFEKSRMKLFINEELAWKLFDFLDC